MDIRRAIQQRMLILDGAMGTELQARGLPPDVSQEEWNAVEPEKVGQVHRDYIAAGADVVLTNSFGANRIKLDKRGMADRVEEFNRAAAQLALEAAAGRAFVLGDIGPLGELLAPLGRLSRQEAHDAFAQQAAALAAAGVHGIIVETMMSLEEAAVAAEAARAVCRLPVFVSGTFNRGKRGYRTVMGETVADFVAAALKAGAEVVGTNCGGGTQDALAIVTEMARCTDGPILAEPNAGVPELAQGKTIFKEDPETWVGGLTQFASMGIRLLGGCCGTTPAHIRRLRELLRESNPSKQ